MAYYWLIGQKMRLHPALDPDSVRDRLRDAGLWVDLDGSVTIDVEGDPAIAIQEHWMDLAPGSWLAYWDQDASLGWMLMITPDGNSGTGSALRAANLSAVLEMATSSQALGVSHSALLVGTDFSRN